MPDEPLLPPVEPNVGHVRVVGPAKPPPAPPNCPGCGANAQRITKLEIEVAELKQQVAELKQLSSWITLGR